MAYLYHLAPENIQGDTLYPLNSLKEKYPEIYGQQIKKYQNREHIMSQSIPYLNCSWGDVLFFSVVDPNNIKIALLESGASETKIRKYYSIDPAQLSPNNTLVYLYSHLNNSGKMHKDNFAKYNPNNLERYSKLPDETKNYYREQIALNKRPLLWHKIPHILYKGSLSTKCFEIIEA